jgi:hypothetical protein
MKYDYTTYYRSFLTESHLLNTQKYIHWFELYVVKPDKNELNKKGKTFIGWKKHIDLLAPHRYSSIIYDKKDKKRKIKYIFDECSSIYTLLKRLEKDYPNVDVYWFKVQQYY